jgi:hypothetical protein
MPLDLSGLDDQAPPPGGQSAPVPGKLDLSLLDDPSLTAAAKPAPTKQAVPQKVDVMSSAIDPAWKAPNGKWSDYDVQQYTARMHNQAASENEGILRGAAGIGHTLLKPVQWLADWISPPQQTMGGLVTGQPTQKNAVSSYIDSIQDTINNLDKSNAGNGHYQTGKVMSQMAMTYPVGGVLGQLARAANLPRLASAIETGGLSTGAAPAAPAAGALSRLGSAAANMGVRVAGGAINGAASAGLADPNSATAGAVAGGALPAVVSGLGNTAKAAGSVYGALSPLWSQKGALNAATQKVAKAVPAQDISQIIGDLQTYFPKGAENIPLSSAAITGSPHLAQLEQGSRLQFPTNWMDFDRNQAKAVFDNVMNATAEAGNIGAARAARSQGWDDAWGKAMSNFKPKVWQKEMGALGPNLDQAMASPEASNPAVRNMLQAIKDEVVRVGPNFSPAHLQQIRANLSASAYNPMSPNAFAAAPRDNPATISVMQELDNILNKSTGGKWQNVLNSYSQGSQAVNAAKAASKVQSSFMDPETGRLLAKTIDPQGAVPIITDSGLTRAMNAARGKDGSQQLSQPAADQLQATIDALRRQNVVQNLKRSATAKGGSDTVSNAIAALPFVGGYLAKPLQKAVLNRDAALTGLLTNPDQLASQLSAYQGAAQQGVLSHPELARVAPVLLADH